MTDFIRPELNNLDKASVFKLMKRVPRIPGAMTMAAGKMLLENKKLIEKLNELRETRGIVPLKDDTAFMNAWDEIQAAVDVNNAYDVMRLSIAENILLTKEINIHRRVLGMDLMKVYKA